MAALDMEVTVTNFNFSEALEDPSSETFSSFQNHFQREVRPREGAQCPRQGHRVHSGLTE